MRNGWSNVMVEGFIDEMPESELYEMQNNDIFNLVWNNASILFKNKNAEAPISIHAPEIPQSLPPQGDSYRYIGHNYTDIIGNMYENTYIFKLDKNTAIKTPSAMETIFSIGAGDNPTFTTSGELIYTFYINTQNLGFDKIMTILSDNPSTAKYSPDESKKTLTYKFANYEELSNEIARLTNIILGRNRRNIANFAKVYSYFDNNGLTLYTPNDSITINIADINETDEIYAKKDLNNIIINKDKTANIGIRSGEGERNLVNLPLEFQNFITNIRLPYGVRLTLLNGNVNNTIYIPMKYYNTYDYRKLMSNDDVLLKDVISGNVSAHGKYANIRLNTYWAKNLKTAQIEIPTETIEFLENTSTTAAMSEFNFIDNVKNTLGDILDRIDNNTLGYNYLNCIRPKTNDSNYVVVGDVFNAINPLELREYNANVVAMQGLVMLIPKHCYRYVRKWNISDRIFSAGEVAIFYNPYTKTLRGTKNGALPEGYVGKIIACPQYDNTLDDKILNTKKLKTNCDSLKKSKVAYAISPTVKIDQITNNYYEKIIDDNDAELRKLDDTKQRLQKLANISNINKQEYNRAKLQNYNDKLQGDIRKVVNKLDNENGNIAVKVNYDAKTLENLDKFIRTYMPNDATKVNVLKRLGDLRKQIGRRQASTTTGTTTGDFNFALGQNIQRDMQIPNNRYILSMDEEEKLLAIIRDSGYYKFDAPNNTNLTDMAKVCYGCNL